LWEIATYDIQTPFETGSMAFATVLVQGGQQPEFQVTPESLEDAARSCFGAGHSGRGQSHEHRGFTGTFEPQPPIVLGLIDSQVHSADEIGGMVHQECQRCSGSCCVTLAR